MHRHADCKRPRCTHGCVTALESVVENEIFDGPVSVEEGCVEAEENDGVFSK